MDASVSARDALELPPEHREHEAARARVSDAYDAMLAAHSSHFHLTTWAMSGDSITAMKLATACRREGIAIRSVRFLTADTLADALPRPEVNVAR